MKQLLDPISMVYWVAVRNVESVSTIPPYGVMEIAGQDGDGTVQVRCPTRDNLTGVLVNGLLPVEPDSQGQGHANLPASILFDPTDGVPAVNEIWGVRAGSYRLARKRVGYKVMGGVYQAEDVLGSLVPNQTAGPGYTSLATFTATERQLVTFCEITSLTKQGIYYPAREKVLDVIAGVVVSGEEIWYYDINGG